MQFDLLLVVIGFVFLAGCATQKEIIPDKALWTPPGQGDLDVADNHQEPAPKKAPRARHVLTPNRAERNAKLR